MSNWRTLFSIPPAVINQKGAGSHFPPSPSQNKKRSHHPALSRTSLLQKLLAGLFLVQSTPFGPLVSFPVLRRPTDTCNQRRCRALTGPELLKIENSKVPEVGKHREFISLATVWRGYSLRELPINSAKSFPPCTARTPAGGECRFSTALPPTSLLPPKFLSHNPNSLILHASQYHPSHLAHRATPTTLHLLPALPGRRGSFDPRQRRSLCASIRNRHSPSRLHRQ